MSRERPGLASLALQLQKQRKVGLRSRRNNTRIRYEDSPSELRLADLRAQIMANIKTAMKARDTLASTTLRAVMSEVNSADKSKGNPISSSEVALIIRKSLQRRTEAAAQYLEANREDLASKETAEAAILNQLLPPLLTSDAIDAQLSSLADVIPRNTDPRKAQGLIFKEFFARVDKSNVDPNLLKERVQNFIQTHLA